MFFFKWRFTFWSWSHHSSCITVLPSYDISYVLLMLSSLNVTHVIEVNLRNITKLFDTGNKGNSYSDQIYFAQQWIKGNLVNFIWHLHLWSEVSVEVGYPHSSFSVIGFRFCRFYRIMIELKKSKMLPPLGSEPQAPDFQVLHATPYLTPYVLEVSAL